MGLDELFSAWFTHDWDRLSALMNEIRSPSAIEPGHSFSIDLYKISFAMVKVSLAESITPLAIGSAK